MGWVEALWFGAQVGAAGRSTLRACRPDYCTGGAGLGLLGWAGSLRDRAPVGAAGRPTMRACRPGFVVVVVDLGLLEWAGSLRVGFPVVRNTAGSLLLCDPGAGCTNTPHYTPHDFCSFLHFLRYVFTEYPYVLAITHSLPVSSQPPMHSAFTVFRSTAHAL